MAQVELENLSKSYGKTDVIREINLSIGDGEFVVLVGPSGCGKSTVLRMVAGLESISQGQIKIDDRVVNHVPPKDRDIAMVFQSYALYPHMNVYDNMAFGLKMRKVPAADIKQKVDRAADILDLKALLERKPKELSGGQRQRVALGRAIVRSPKVFLMDEPLSNLDAKLRVHMRAEIQKLHQQLHVTTIYVTHDQTEAMTMGHRIVVLNGGVIQQVGTPTEVYNRPANLFVGGFIGSMMFLTATYSNGQLQFASGQSWQAPESFRKALEPLHGKSVKVGLRPEHFGPVETGRQSLAIEPEIVETLGPEKMVHFVYEGETIVASLPPDMDVPLRQSLTLSVNLDKASYFDAQNGQNVLCQAEPVAIPVGG